MFHASCSMLFNVPQFINIEDKIVGPLTAKQLGWLAIGGVLLLIFWGFLDFSAFLMVAFVDAAIFSALAFYKPYNQPLIKFLGSSIYFMFRPRVYIWKRGYDNIKTVKRNVIKKETPHKKSLDSEKVRELTKILNQNH